MRLGRRQNRPRAGFRAFPTTRRRRSTGSSVADARIGSAARQIISGDARRAVGHATSGPALQQTLVCVLEARP